MYMYIYIYVFKSIYVYIYVNMYIYNIYRWANCIYIKYKVYIYIELQFAAYGKFVHVLYGPSSATSSTFSKTYFFFNISGCHEDNNFFSIKSVGEGHLPYSVLIRFKDLRLAFPASSEK